MTFKCPQCGGSEYYTPVTEDGNYGCRTDGCHWNGPASECGLATTFTCPECGGERYEKFEEEIWCNSNATYRQLECNWRGPASECGVDPQPVRPAREQHPERQPLTSLEGQPAGLYLCGVDTIGNWTGTALMSMLDWPIERNFKMFTRLYDAADVEAIAERAHQHFADQIIKQTRPIVEQCEQCRQQLATVTAERDELRSVVEAVNALAREYGFGQGELDDDLAGCLRRHMDAVTAERDEARRASCQTLARIQATADGREPHDSKNSGSAAELAVRQLRKHLAASETENAELRAEVDRLKRLRKVTAEHAELRESDGRSTAVNVTTSSDDWESKPPTGPTTFTG